MEVKSGTGRGEGGRERQSEPANSFLKTSRDFLSPENTNMKASCLLATLYGNACIFVSHGFSVVVRVEGRVHQVLEDNSGCGVRRDCNLASTFHFVSAPT